MDFGLVFIRTGTMKSAMARRLAVITFGRMVAGLCFWMGAGVACGHQDPWGDIHPQVFVLDGKFAIDFNSSIPDQEDGYSEGKPVQRMIFNADGSLFAPRHPTERKRSHMEMGPAGLYGKSVPLGESTLIFGSERSAKPGYILKSSEGKLTKVSLPWPEKTGLTMFEDVVVTAKGIAITGKEPGPNSDSEENTPLHFYWFSHGETGPPIILDIGPTACIYDFPVASNLAFAGGRFWVGLMRPIGEDLKVALWSWKLGEKDGRMEILDSPAHWNSHMSLAASGDQLCLAYHCTVPDTRNLRSARIVTVFRKAE